MLNEAGFFSTIPNSSCLKHVVERSIAGDSLGFDPKRARLATKAGTEGREFTIHAPLQHLTKADIAREAQRLGLDAALSHSCYDPLPDGRHCGLCDACRLRAKGFAEAGIADPTRYAAVTDET